MNIIKKSNLTVLTICAFAATIVSAATYINELNIKTNIATVTTVTIAAQRMTEQQKIAFDAEQAGNSMQTIFIAAKRLSPEEKFAIDQQEKQILQAKNRTHKKPQLLV